MRTLKNSLNTLAVGTAKQVFALVDFNVVFPTTAATYYLYNNTILHKTTGYTSMLQSLITN